MQEKCRFLFLYSKQIQLAKAGKTLGKHGKICAICKSHNKRKKRNVWRQVRREAKKKSIINVGKIKEHNKSYEKLLERREK